MVRREALVAAVFVLAVGLACKKGSGDDAKDKAVASASVASPSSASGGKGLGAPGNDPAVVKLAEAALACEWTSGGLKYNCPQAEAWAKADLLKDGQADRTLVAMLDDERPAVRWMGAKGLTQFGKTYAQDAALAKRVVAAAQAETDVTVADPLGAAAGKIDVSKTGLKDDIQKLVTSHSLTKLRTSVIGRTQSANRNEMFEFMIGVAKGDKDAAVRRAAIDSFWVGTPTGKNTEACEIWLDRMKSDAADEVAGKAAYLLLFAPNGQCQEQWDAALGVVEGRAAAGKAKDSNWGSSLSYFYGQSKATAAQKARAIAIAKKMVENTSNSGTARSSAIRFVGEKSPDGKTFAARFKDDKEFFVKSSVKRLLEGK